MATRVLTALVVLLGLSTLSNAECSFDRCGDEDGADGTYAVHVVPHSHMDLGWLKTVQQYFFGTNGKENGIAVQYIYDSVVAELLADENKRFMFVETGFFELWWKHRGNESREAFRKLVHNGQIEFVSGGYVMNDEAATYYTNTIDQMTFGLGILKDLFGKCGVSRVGWQIDPFGHSREFASLLSQMNYNGLFLGRIDYQDKDARESSATMEFKWRASESLPKSTLTGVVLANNYSPPPGFCFDIYCDDDVVVDDESSEEYNLRNRTTELIKWINERAKYFATNNFLVTMGNDFNYHSAHKWYSNLDTLMRHINSRSDFKINGLPVRMKYSTPSCYLKAIQSAKLAPKYDDFFPYSSDPHAFWTGYFTSRPAFKYLDRFANNVFQAAKQLVSMAHLGTGRLDLLRRALAIGQHHDAITGTAKQFVNDDYTRSTLTGLNQAYEVIAEAFQSLSGTSSDDEVIFCKSLNISACDEIDDIVLSQGIAVNVYNPSSQKVEYYVRVPVSNGKVSFAVTGSDGQNIVHDVLPIPDFIRKLPERSAKATHEIVFPVEIGPHGFEHVIIEPQRSFEGNTYEVVDSSEDVTLHRGGVSMNIHRYSAVVNAGEGNTSILPTYFYYSSHAGDNHDFDHRASGAYIFRPNGSDEVRLEPFHQQTIKGNTMTEVRTEYTSWLSDILRITNSGDVEVDWLVGPIPVDDKIGKEVILRVFSDVGSTKNFFTDSNGRETIQRVRDFRPTWNVSLEEPVAGNYYPVNSRIGIRDSSRELLLLPDRSVGGTCKNGEVEIMIHRRCLHDDAFGVNEALNEPGFDGRGLQVRGTAKILVTAPNSTEGRSAGVRNALKPIAVFSKKPLKLSQGLINTQALPKYAELLTLEQVGSKQFLVRVENIQDRRPGATSVSVDLLKLFNGRLSSVKETYLAANVDKASPGTVRVARLYPMEIRTFIVTVR